MLQSFKNLIIYELKSPFLFDKKKLESLFSEFKFIPCKQFELIKSGWISPFSSSNHNDDKQNENLIYEIRNQFVFSFYKEEKMLPVQIIKMHLNEKIIQLENQFNKTLNKEEKKSLKDEIIQTLAPRAFSRFNETKIWVNPEKSLIFVDASNHKRAEEALSFLRKTLGSLPVSPYKKNENLENLMTNWVFNEQFPENFSFIGALELKNAQNNSIAIFKNQEFLEEEIKNFIKLGKKVIKIKLNWMDEFQFFLKNDGTFKNIRFEKALSEKKEHSVKQDFDDKSVNFDESFLLISEKITLLLSNLWQDTNREC